MDDNAQWGTVAASLTTHLTATVDNTSPLSHVLDAVYMTISADHTLNQYQSCRK